MADRRKPARWRREPMERGLAAVARTLPYGSDLRVGGEVVIRVRALSGWLSDPWTVRCWYWYGLDVSGSVRRFATHDEAKADARAYYEAHRAAKEPDHG